MSRIRSARLAVVGPASSTFLVLVASWTMPSPGRAQSAIPDSTATSELADTLREPPAIEFAGAYAPYSRALERLAAGAAAGARAELENALSLDSLYAPALSLLSKLDFQEGRHEESIARLAAARERARAAGGDLSRSLLAGLALHYDAIDRPDLAAALVSGAEPTTTDGASPVVYLTLRGPRPEAAGALAEAALQRNPRSAVNQNNYGITQLRIGHVEAAQRAFATAIELDPSLPGPYYNLAILEKFYRFDDDAAERWLTEYRARSTADPDGLFEIFGAPAAPEVRTGGDE